MRGQRYLNAVIVASQLVGTAHADSTTTIDPKTTWGTWEGWGVSLAWWAAAFGDEEDLASAFFSLKNTTVNGQNVPGLGFNIARYNAGASSSNSIDGETMQVSPRIIPSRLVEGYWLNDTSTSPTSSSWDWSRDPKQRNMLQLAQDNGANIFELFSNSPMWWQTINHNPSGADNASENNLSPTYYTDHAIYLATIAAYAKQNWGIDFATVEAFNEPSSSYWGANGTQEGCHFDASTQATILPLLRQQLDAVGLTQTSISASDETAYDVAITTWNSFSSSTKALVNRVNVHGYQGSGGRRDILYDIVSADGKALWNSEFGDGDGTGTGLVQDLMLDMYWLHPTAWVYWQAIDGGGWGLIDGDNDNHTIGTAEKKYFALAQFSRHIRQGMQILSSSSENVVAAYSADEQKLVIVAANWGGEGYVNFDLSKFGSAGSNGALVVRWSTQINGTNDYVEKRDTYLSGTKFWSYFVTGEVMTFEVEGVVV